MFDRLQKMGERPQPYEYYTADLLWTDPYVSEQMLGFHLDENLEMSSRKAAFIRRSVDWIISRFKVGVDTAICDFGCGPGLYAIPLAQTGADVTGIDFSPSSIAYARQTAQEQNLAIDYVCQDYLDFSTSKRFDLIFMIFCDFCALSPVQRAALLAKWQDLLAPGGAVLMDVFTLKFFDTTEEKITYAYSAKDGFWAPGPYYAFLNTFKYQAEKVILDKWTVLEPDRERLVYNWLQCYSPGTLERELSASGFQIQEHFANVAGDPFAGDTIEMAVVLTKI